MKKENTRIALLFLALVALLVQPAVAGNSGIGAVARFHKTHEAFDLLPVTDGDISYGVTAEYHESEAFWQLGVTYTDKPGTNDVEFIVTPQVNLIFKDRYWLGGMGVLTSYLDRGEKEDSEWLDPYWQFLMGIQLPLAKLQIRGMAYYVFEDWSEITEFSFDELEFDVSLVFYF
jgi:hypothetical protein